MGIRVRNDGEHVQIDENNNSDPEFECGDRTELDRLCASAIKRRGRRGRPPGSGKKHPPGQPKTFRNFSNLAHLLLGHIRLTGPELLAMTDADVVEEALVRFARDLSNRNPRLADKLRRVGR